MKRNNGLTIFSAVLLVAASAIATPVAIGQDASLTDPSFMLTATGNGFEVVDVNGNTVGPASNSSDLAQSISYYQAEDGNAALLLELNWLTRPGIEPEDTSGGQGGERKHIDPDGNLVAIGGVTEEQTRIPSDISSEALIGVLTTSHEAQIALGELYRGEAFILRDGVKVGALQQGVFIDRGLEPGGSYEYTIESSTSPTLRAEDTSQQDPAHLLDNSDPIEQPDAFSLTLTAHTLGEARPSPRSLDASSSPYSLPTQTVNTWVHMTYIPQATVPTAWYEGLVCSFAEAFVGDGRGDTYPTEWSFPSHRTAIRVAVNWQNPDPWQIYWEKSTGITGKIVGGEVVETRQASTDGIEVLDTWMTGNVAHFNIRHDVGDPFCLLGSVKYRETVQFWKSGAVAVNGRHNHVPNHESYASYAYDSLGNKTFTKVWNFDDAIFTCLVGWSVMCDKTYMASKNF